MIISKLMHKYALVRDKKPVSWSVGQFFFTPLQMSWHLIHHIRKMDILAYSKENDYLCSNFKQLELFNNHKKQHLKMKTVLVTGANKGIGFGIAKHLGLSGWRVIIGARHQERAEKAIEALKDAGINVLGWVNIELTSAECLEQAAQEIAEKYPELTLLVNNAGIPGDMSVNAQQTELKDIKETLEVNFIGTFTLTQLLMSVLEKNNGRIVNVTVPSEISPYWHPLAYVTSKAAQNAMMGVMAMEFQQKGRTLETFSVHPGPTTTDLNGNMSLPGFHDIETVGAKFAELINDGKTHQGEFIELYPIVKED